LDLSFHDAAASDPFLDHCVRCSYMPKGSQVRGASSEFGLTREFT
jgi:hypothetical protein